MCLAEPVLPGATSTTDQVQCIDRVCNGRDLKDNYLAHDRHLHLEQMPGITVSTGLQPPCSAAMPLAPLHCAAVVFGCAQQPASVPFLVPPANITPICSFHTCILLHASHIYTSC